MNISASICLCLPAKYFYIAVIFPLSSLSSSWNSNSLSLYMKDRRRINYWYQNDNLPFIWAFKCFEFITRFSNKHDFSILFSLWKLSNDLTTLQICFRVSAHLLQPDERMALLAEFDFFAGKSCQVPRRRISNFYSAQRWRMTAVGEVFW